MSTHEYSDEGLIFEGRFHIPKGPAVRRPCVMIAHAWDGPNAHFDAMAAQMTERGYAGFALDIYGKGNRGRIDGDNSHLMNPLLHDRALLRRRLLAAFGEARNHPRVMPDKIAILGYCFGGLCALDLARASPPGLRAAISVHGQLTGAGANPGRIEASVLVLHGWEDPTAKPPAVLDFAAEMTRAQADWQIHCYGHAKHAFTFAGADIPSLGIKYDEKAHRRSEKAVAEFLREVLE